MRQHIPVHATQWVKLLFHPLSAASLMRSRSLSRLSANEEGRVVFRVTKSMLKTQDSELRHRAFVELLVVTSTGQRKETPYRHVDTVKGKSGERTALRSDGRKALSSLFASSRESSVTRIYYGAMHCRRLPLPTNSFHLFSRTCCPPLQLVSRVTSPSHLFLSPSLSFHPRWFVFSVSGRISPRDHA